MTVYLSPSWLPMTLMKAHATPAMIIGFVVLLAAAVGIIRSISKYDSRRRHMPPKVPGWPIINQTLWHQQDDLATNAIKWTREYGEIWRTRTGTTDWIWLSSGEAIKELIDRQSAVLSSRSYNPMGFGAASGGKRIVFMPYGKKWRTLRTIVHKLLTPAMAKSYAPIQQFEAKQLSVDLLNKPEDFYMHNRRYTASLIMQIVYGRRLPNWDCDEIKKIFGCLFRFGQTRRPGQWLVDSFPSLADQWWFNYFSDWRAFGNEVHKKDSAVWMEFWNQMVREVEAGTAPHSFGRGFVQSDWAKKGLDELQAAYVCGAMIEAGSETTSVQLNNTIVGILSRGRKVIDVAHEEVDRVIGKDRTPTFDDEPNLPYIRAMVKEVMRWRFVNKFGTNHYAMEDLWYKGYFIPKGSTVMLNIWGANYDLKRWTEPEKYEPMRFYNFPLSAAEAVNTADPNGRDHYSYGGGRRICPGMHVAERSLFLNIARLVWAFDIKHAQDENGNDIPVEATFTGLSPGATAAPSPFKADIKIRSPQHEAVIRHEWAQAQKEGVHIENVKYSI